MPTDDLCDVDLLAVLEHNCGHGHDYDLCPHECEPPRYGATTKERVVTYQELERAFPYCIRAPHVMARAYIEALLDEDRTDVAQGSSFALTVDNGDGTCNLWVSETSMTLLNSIWTDLPEQRNDGVTD